MDNYTKLQKEILATLKRLEKSGTFDKFFEHIPQHEWSFEDYIPPSPSPTYTYKNIKSFCGTTAAELIHEAEMK